MNPDQIRALRARLGLTEAQLPDNATQAQINAALGVTAAEPPEGESQAGDPDEETAPAGSEPPATPGEGAGEPNDGSANAPLPPEEPTNASIPEGMMLVPQTEWARVQQGTQAALARAETDENDRRDRALTAGLGDGRIRPADVPSYRNMHAAGGASREVFYRLLTETVENGGLAAGLVPVTERGNLPTGDGTTGSQTTASEYDDNWLSPQERARIAAINAGEFSPDRVSMDGNYNRNGAGAGAL